MAGLQRVRGETIGDTCRTCLALTVKSRVESERSQKSLRTSDALWHNIAEWRDGRKELLWSPNPCFRQLFFSPFCSKRMGWFDE